MTDFVADVFRNSTTVPAASAEEPLVQEKPPSPVLKALPSHSLSLRETARAALKNVVGDDRERQRGECKMALIASR